MNMWLEAKKTNKQPQFTTIDWLPARVSPSMVELMRSVVTRSSWRTRTPEYFWTLARDLVEGQSSLNNSLIHGPPMG